MKNLTPAPSGKAELCAHEKTAPSANLGSGIARSDHRDSKPQAAPRATAWTPSQLARRHQVESGLAVVASLRRGIDAALIEWATQAGLAVRIDRRSKWGNPYPMRNEADRAAVCDRYADHLATRPDLLAQIGELRGRVLLCWCHPKPCHGDHLAELANGAEVTE